MLRLLQRGASAPSNGLQIHVTSDRRCPLCPSLLLLSGLESDGIRLSHSLHLVVSAGYRQHKIFIWLLSWYYSDYSYFFLNSSQFPTPQPLSSMNFSAPVITPSPPPHHSPGLRVIRASSVIANLSHSTFPMVTFQVIPSVMPTTLQNYQDPESTCSSRFVTFLLRLPARALGISWPTTVTTLGYHRTSFHSLA